MTPGKKSFSKEERLKSRKEISRIFKNGIFLYSDSLSLGYTYSEKNKFAVSVPKRLFKSAVVRNKIKRRIRESYRLNKNILHNYSTKFGQHFNVLIIYRHNTPLPYQAIREELVFLLEKLIETNKKRPEFL